MRRRLVLAIAGVAAVAIVMFAVPLGIVLSRSYHDREQLKLQRDAVAATRSIDLGPPAGDPVELPRTNDSLAVYDRSGRRAAGLGPARADGVVSAALRTGRTVDGTSSGELLVAVPLVVNERVTGALRAVRSDAAADHAAGRAWLALAALAVALILAAALAALVAGRRLSRPLERLAAAARRLGDGDFSVRAEPSAIPEVDAVATALDTTAERLDDLLTRERSFSADASHQLRTPLAALRIELEAIELGPRPPAELPAALAQVDRLQATIDTLLAVARDTPRRTEPADLVTALDELQARWHGPLAAEGRALRTAVRTNSPTTSAPAAIVTEILEVLVDNARRHGAGAITVIVRDAGTGVAVDVTDEGTGFDGDPEAAFARRTSAEGGHGIGLALARSLAESEGGRLSATRAGPEPRLTLLLPRHTI